MEFTNDYRVVLNDVDNPLAVKGLVPAPEGGFYLGDIFRTYDTAWDERSAFSHGQPVESVLGDTALTNLKRLEALQTVVSAAMHHLPQLHDIHDIRDLPAHEARAAEKEL